MKVGYFIFLTHFLNFSSIFYLVSSIKILQFIVAYRLKSVIELTILITVVLDVKIAYEHLTRVEIEATDGEKMNEIAE